MARRTWKKGNLLLSFGNPCITPFEEEKELYDMKDVCYFYYDLTILHGKKELLSFSTHDFPKVHMLPFYLDEIMNFDMKKPMF